MNEDPATSAVQIKRRKYLVTTVLAVAVIAGVSLIAWHFQQNSQSTKHSANLAATMDPKEYNQLITHPDKVYTLVMNEDKLVSGPTKITVNRGDSVNINLRATHDETRMQLDGYDIITEASPAEGADGGFHFVADKAGTFKYYAFDEEAEGKVDGASMPRVEIGTLIVKE